MRALDTSPRKLIVLAAVALALIGCTALAQGAGRNAPLDYTVSGKELVPPTDGRGRMYRVHVWLDGTKQHIDYEEDRRLCWYAARVGKVLPVVGDTTVESRWAEGPEEWGCPATPRERLDEGYARSR